VSLGSPCFAHVKLKRKPRIKTDLYLSFEDLLIKGRSANGILITKHKVSSVKEISRAAYMDSTDESRESSNAPSTGSATSSGGRQRRDKEDQPLLFSVDDPDGSS
jgi:hypothetical protein